MRRPEVGTVVLAVHHHRRYSQRWQTVSHIAVFHRAKAVRNGCRIEIAVIPQEVIYQDPTTPGIPETGGHQLMNMLGAIRDPVRLVPAIRQAGCRHTGIAADQCQP